MHKRIRVMPYLMSVKFNLLLLFSTGIILLTLMSPVYAEYYFVTPTPPRVINLNGYPCHHRYYRHYKHVVKKKVRHYHHPCAYAERYHRVHRVRPVVVYYAAPAPCCGCQEVFVQGRWDCYSGGCGGSYVTYDGYVYETYAQGSPIYVRDEITYNPDLTTGDDDTWVNPDMDIDE